MKPKKLYTGNTLTQENFNNLIEKVRGLEQTELNISDLEQVFETGDDLEGSRITFFKNQRDEIESFTVSILETTDRTPLFSEDFLVFENEDLTNVLLDSDFQVVRKSNGELINGSEYGLLETGKILFAIEHDENEILLNGLNYTDQKTYYIGRDPLTRVINRISMEPQFDTENLVEQALHPQTILSNNDALDVLDLNRNKTYTNDSQNLFLGGSGGSELSKNFILDFKENVMPRRVEFSFYQGVTDYGSVDFWGSQNGTDWTRLKKLRNIKESDTVEGKHEALFDLVGVFRFLKFEIFHSTYSETKFSEVQVLGYHPENKKMKSVNKMGAFGLLSEGVGTGASYNDIFRITTNKLLADTEGEFAETSILYTNSGSQFQLTPDEWILYEFTEPTEIERIRFITANRIEWKLEASNDGVNFFELVKRFEEEGNDEKTIIGVVDKPVKVKFYRFTVLTIFGYSATSINVPLILE